MLSNNVKGLNASQRLVGEFATSLLSYEVDNVLHPLLQARHAQFPYFELHGFLREHLAGHAHGRPGISPLGWLP